MYFICLLFSREMCICVVFGCVICSFARCPVICEFVFVFSFVARPGGRGRFILEALFWYKVLDLDNVIC